MRQLKVPDKQAWITVPAANTSRFAGSWSAVCSRSPRRPAGLRPSIILPAHPRGRSAAFSPPAPENLGFGRMRAIAETIRAVDSALAAIHVDSDVLFGAAAEMFWDLPPPAALPAHALALPLRPASSADGFSREICLELLADSAAAGKRCLPPFVFSRLPRDSLPALDFMAAFGRKLAARGNEHWHEEAAWNAWLWRHGRRRRCRSAPMFPTIRRTRIPTAADALLARERPGQGGSMLKIIEGLR